MNWCRDVYEAPLIVYDILQNNTENIKLQNKAEIKHTQNTENTRFKIKKI